LATQDFHLFQVLKDAIHWQRSSRYDGVTAETKKWLRVQDLNWYKKGIDVLVSWWCKDVEVGDYVKNEVCNTSI
jgi:hypothetical protein